MQVILVSIGIFQDYIIYNIKQLLLFNYEIIIITEKKFFDNLKQFINIKLVDANEINICFDKYSKLDDKFRDGFWKNTSKRLFLLYQYIKDNNITNCFHLENDVLLYYNFNDYIFDDKIYLVMDSENRCIPGIIYIPSYKHLDNLIKNYNYNCNDMINMSFFYHNNLDKCCTFPIIKKNTYYDKIDIYSENYNEFNGIFDGAAIGQYLGGVDPRNIPGDSTGFINETCIVKYNNYNFKWKKNEINDLYIPYIVIDDIDIPIYNLHIHSKMLNKFISNSNQLITNNFIKIS